LPANILIAAGLGLMAAPIISIATTVYARPMPSQFAAVLQQDAEAGQTIFQQKCAGCHTIGKGNLVGPDLKDVTKVRDLQWVKNFILDPANMIANDADAQQLFLEYNKFPMPDLGLTEAEADHVVAYLQDPNAVAAPASSAPVNIGDPTAGYYLFTGQTRLKNGGPPCLGCHHVSGVGALGGGGLGPDLTEVVERLGEPGLAAALQTLPFPTMIGPFKNHLLTEDEQADLLAYFKNASVMQPPPLVSTPGAWTEQVWLMFIIGLVLTGVLFAILWLIWLPLKKRYQTRLPVRKV
jgi:cytochrome c2